MKTNFLVTCALAAMISSVGISAQAAPLTDPGFEDPASLTFDGGPFVGSWEGFNNGGASVTDLGTDPFEGASNLNLLIPDANGFAGAFQDVAAFEGADVTFSGWHREVASNGGNPTEVRIEWIDGGGGVISATPNATPDATASYEPFSLTATAPAGTAFARVVYAIQTFGATATQQVSVDALSATVVPEPTSAILALLAVAPLARRRR